jgi:hypothetical protein
MVLHQGLELANLVEGTDRSTWGGWRIRTLYENNSHYIKQNKAQVPVKTIHCISSVLASPAT